MASLPSQVRLLVSLGPLSSDIAFPFIDQRQIGSYAQPFDFSGPKELRISLAGAELPGLTGPHVPCDPQPCIVLPCPGGAFAVQSNLVAVLGGVVARASIYLFFLKGRALPQSDRLRPEMILCSLCLCAHER